MTNNIVLKPKSHGGLFWNNDKQHGIKTLKKLNFSKKKFWNNDKQHSVKMCQQAVKSSV